jgi:hypothetical protein
MTYSIFSMSFANASKRYSSHQHYVRSCPRCLVVLGPTLPTACKPCFRHSNQICNASETRHLLRVPSRCPHTRVLAARPHTLLISSALAPRGGDPRMDSSNPHPLAPPSPMVIALSVISVAGYTFFSSFLYWLPSFLWFRPLSLCSPLCSGETSW